MGWPSYILNEPPSTFMAEVHLLASFCPPRLRKYGMGRAAFWACRETFLFGLFILFQESVDKREDLLLLEFGQSL